MCTAEYATGCSAEREACSGAAMCAPGLVTMKPWGQVLLWKAAMLSAEPP